MWCTCCKLGVDGEQNRGYYHLSWSKRSAEHSKKIQSHLVLLNKALLQLSLDELVHLVRQT